MPRLPLEQTAEQHEPGEYQARIDEERRPPLELRGEEQHSQLASDGSAYFASRGIILSDIGSATFANGSASIDEFGNITAQNLGQMASQADAPDTLHQYARVKGSWQTISGGGGSSNQLINGSYSVFLDSLGNTTFPNATVEASGLVISQGVGSYDTIGVGSTGSLGYGLNNIALNPDGSASFANGAAGFDLYGNLTAANINQGLTTTSDVHFGRVASYVTLGDGGLGVSALQGYLASYGLIVSGDYGGFSILAKKDSPSGCNIDSDYWYIHSDGSASFSNGAASFDSLGNLTAANFPQTIPVTSVAGKTGDVALSASDVGAASVGQSIAFAIALS